MGGITHCPLYAEPPGSDCTSPLGPAIPSSHRETRADVRALPGARVGSVPRGLDSGLERDLLSGTRSEAGAEQVGVRDLAVLDLAVQLLLDDVGLSFFDALEPVRDVNSVADLARL